MVADVQMSLFVCNTVTLGTSEHPLPQTASLGYLNIHYHEMLPGDIRTSLATNSILGTSEHLLSQTASQGHLNILYHKQLPGYIAMLHFGPMALLLLVSQKPVEFQECVVIGIGKPA